MKRSAITNCVIVTTLATLLIVTAFGLPKTETVFAPIRQGSSPQTVALTVNVYLGTEYVKEIVQILNEYSVKATFFLGGCWVAKNEETAQLLVQYGHCIGSHGYSHLDHGALDYDRNYAEMSKAHQTILQATGVAVTLFAPPSGAYNDYTLQAAKEMGYQVTLWSKDTIDWRDQDPDLLFKRATKDMHAGDIILTHPTQATVQMLPRLIETYLSHGYRFVTMDEMV